MLYPRLELLRFMSRTEAAEIIMLEPIRQSHHAPTPPRPSHLAFLVLVVSSHLSHLDICPPVVEHGTCIKGKYIHTKQCNAGSTVNIRNKI